MPREEVTVKGPLTVSCAGDGDASVVSVSGELDLSGAEVFEQMLN
jgi:hypothetical protein